MNGAPGIRAATDAKRDTANVCDALCISATTNAGGLRLWLRMTAKNKQRPSVRRSSLPVFSFAKRASDRQSLMQSVVDTFVTRALRYGPGLLEQFPY